MAVLLAMVGRTLADNLTVADVTMNAGEKKQVSIVLNNPDHQYAAFQFDLMLPDGVTIATNTKGKLIASLNEDRKDDHSLTVTDVGGGTYRFLAFSMTNAEFYGTSGALVDVTLEASAGAANGAKTAKLTSQVFTEVSGTQSKWDDVSFGIELKGGSSVTPDDPPVTSGDDMLTVEPVTMHAGETRLLAIELKNPDHQYAGFQFDLVLPEGVSIANNAKGKPDARLNDDRKDDHTLTVTDVGGGTYRFLSFSMTNAEYYGKSGALVYVTLQAAEGIGEGIKTATIQSQVFTEENNTQHKLADQLFQITIEAAVVPVTVTAKSYTREYGDANPAFGYTSEGATLNGTPEITCEATPSSPVGTYPIVIKKGSVTNSGDSYVNGTLTITKAPLTISGGTYSMKQGDPLPAFAAVYSGFKNGETSPVLSKQPTLTTTATSASAPGAYEVTVSGAEAKNYDISYNKGTLTITDADPITVTVKSVSREYGDANPTFDYTVAGGTLDGTPEISCSATVKSDVGTYDITIAKGSVKNYNVTFIGGKLTITKAPLTISGGTYSMKQGDALPTFNAVYSGWKNGDTEAVLTKKPMLTTTATSSSTPGTYDVNVSGAEAKNYDITYKKGTLTITDADPITVTVKSVSREYGEANPTFEYTVAGGTLDGTPEISCAATEKSDVGTYDITIAKGSVKNYNVTFIGGKLTVTKAPLTISGGTYSMKQGDPLPAFAAVYSGFKNGETSAVLSKQPTLTTTATSASAPGTYDVNVSGAEAKNYDISYKKGTLTITDADPITVTVKSVSRQYGETNPTFEYTVDGGTLDGTPEINCTATEKSDVGTYDITITKGSVKNYNVTFVDGKLTVTKAPLTISGGTYSMKQGETLPTFKATYSGWKNGDTEAVLTKKPTLTTTATSASTPGTYDVNVSGAEAKNYDISYKKGTLTITDADPITVTVKGVSREYGDANPTFEFTVAGGTLDGTPEISCAATEKSDVGTYDITITKGSVKNYNVTFIGGKLTITKAPLTISGGTYSMKQGETLPIFKATYSGWKNGDTEAVLTKKPTLTTTATSASTPGTYDVNVSGAEAKNYDITYKKGTLTITDADPITVMVKSVSREYGDANPTFEYTVAGGTLDGMPEISCSATAKSDVGTYDITITKGSVKNYNVTFIGGKLTVTKAPLTISGGTYTMKQGETLPIFKATYSGWKNGDTEAVLTKKPTLTTTATSASTPGTYDVNVSGAEAKNYDISYKKGSLTITEAETIVVTVSDAARNYGDENPVFSFVTSGGKLNGLPEITCEATETSPVGTYTINIGKGSVTNSNVTYVSGTLEVTEAPLTIKVGTYTRKQGEDNPQFTVTYEGWKNGETEAVLTQKPTLTCNATKDSPVGLYEIVVSGAEAPNYYFNYINGSLNVTEADPVLVTAKSYTREYGEANPTFEFTSEGATLEGKPEISCEATATSPVGTYPIVIKKGGVTNYNDTYANGTLTITKAPLTISGGDYVMKQGDAMPTLKAVYAGFKNGETSAVLTKQPTLTTTATSASIPGTYEVIVSGAEAENYEISYDAGTLTIVDADAVVVMAKSYTREYGEANPTFEFTSEGATLEGQPEISCEATATSPVGTYPIVIKKGGVTNYNDSYVNGTLTITKAPLTIDGGEYTMKQGEDVPMLKAEYSGFKNGETEAMLKTKPMLKTTATSGSEPGVYEVTVSGAEAENYEISYVAGKLTILEADAVVVTAKSYTREYGEANPTFEFTSEGATLEGTPEIVCTATATSPVGTYPIIIKKGSVTNYNDQYVSGALTITKAPLKVTVADATREQGEENPEFVITYEGWKNGETETVLTKKPVATTTATKDSAVGEYVIVVSGGEAQNYELSYVNGKLTVTVPNGIRELLSGGTFNVYTTSGKLIRKGAASLKGLAKGVYIVNGQKVIVK